MGAWNHRACHDGIRQWSKLVVVRVSHCVCTPPLCSSVIGFTAFLGGPDSSAYTHAEAKPAAVLPPMVTTTCTEVPATDSGTAAIQFGTQNASVIYLLVSNSQRKPRVCSTYIVSSAAVTPSQRRARVQQQLCSSWRQQGRQLAL
ncbi:unnamed protein product, partial [Ectocarpus sp. 12 AP-2014]